MAFPINLLVCLFYVLATFGILLAGGGAATGPNDAPILLFFLSPALLWASGGWAVRGRRGSSIAWLVASALLMGVGLLGIFDDVEASRQEAITQQYTMHMSGFLATLLQWVVGLPLLAILALIRLLTRGKPPEAAEAPPGG